MVLFLRRQGLAMGQLEKLIARIRARPTEADFEDVRALLEAFGWLPEGGKGSHRAFRRAGHRTITIPTVRGRKVKRIYLDQVCELLGLDED
ncbi:MAG: type II toxin-antitoxin system HicA family toxin [Chloroflexi bacterium]|nr:type II toxin-antitoxin system HicA family toxin [Chloroflexota bacterium]